MKTPEFAPVHRSGLSVEERAAKLAAYVTARGLSAEAFAGMSYAMKVRFAAAAERAAGGSVEGGGAAQPANPSPPESFKKPPPLLKEEP